MELSKVIEKAMIDKDVKTRKQLAELSSVPYGTINSILNGQNTSLKSANKVLNSLGLQLTVSDKV